MVKKNQRAQNQRRTVAKYNLRTLRKGRPNSNRPATTPMKHPRASSSKQTRRRVLAQSLSSHTVPSTDSNADRDQLIENLRNIGILAPSSCSTAVLRELWNENSHVPSSQSALVKNSTRTTAGSFPFFDVESNSGEDDGNSDDQPAPKTVPRTYSLFNCPFVDSSDADDSTIEFVSPALRKAIQQGKDVCLAHLLIPPEHSMSQYKDSVKDFTSLYLKSSDPRLQRSLSLTDFILAFIRYMNIMTEVHPERRIELTSYFSFVIKLGVQFPAPLFYEYHKSFSRKAAAILFAKGRKINWAVRDDDLYFQIFVGRRGPGQSKRWPLRYRLGQFTIQKQIFFDSFFTVFRRFYMSSVPRSDRLTFAADRMTDAATFSLFVRV